MQPIHFQKWENDTDILNLYITLKRIKYVWNYFLENAEDIPDDLHSAEFVSEKFLQAIEKEMDERKVSSPPSKLTYREMQVLDYIEQHISIHNVSPTLKEIQGHLGLKTDTSPDKIIKRLIKRGYLDKTPGRARSLRIIRDWKEIAPPDKTVNLNTLRTMDKDQLKALLLTHERKAKTYKSVPQVIFENIEKIRNEIVSRSTRKPKKKSSQHDDSNDYVYIMDSPIGQKIGHSKNPHKRLKTIQTSNPETELIHAVLCVNATNTEKVLQKFLAEYRHKKEWFQIPQDILDDLLTLDNEVEVLEYCSAF